jgi:hypothetical protein
MRKVLVWVASGTLAFTACDGFGQAVSSHTNVVARAAGHELTVERAAAMLAPRREIPAQRDVIDAVANLWVDYMLLATAASQDSTLNNVDLDAYLKPYFEQAMVVKLRDKVIQYDTIISDDSLRAQFERDDQGVEVRARHILLQMPPDAAPAVRDSVTRLAQDLQRRASSGEDFATLARSYSQDGSAAQGGDLGYTRREGPNSWVPPFADAAFAMRPGQISDVVETPFGLHIIKVEDRRQPKFEDVSAEFRANAVARRRFTAESMYVSGLTDPLTIAVQEGAVENAKEIARSPNNELRGRAGSRALVRYEGGSLSASEFLEVIRGWNPPFRGQLVAAPEAQVKQVLEGIARNKILVAEAEKQNLNTSELEADSLRATVRMQLRGAAQASGLTSIQPQDGETMHQAQERRVGSLLEAILNNEQSAIPLGPLSYSLRRQFEGEIFDRSFDTVIARIEAQRPPAAPAPTAPPATGDTSAGR